MGNEYSDYSHKISVDDNEKNSVNELFNSPFVDSSGVSDMALVVPKKSKNDTSRAKHGSKKEAKEIQPEEIIDELTKPFICRYKLDELDEDQLTEIGKEKHRKFMKEREEREAGSYPTSSRNRISSMLYEGSHEDYEDQLLQELEKKEVFLELLFIYNQVIKRNPRSFEGHLERGISFMMLASGHTMQKQYLQFSLQDFMKAVRINPWTDPRSYYYRALAYKRLNSRSLALDDFTKSVGIDPEFKKSWIELGNIFYDRYKQSASDNIEKKRRRRSQSNNNNKSNEPQQTSSEEEKNINNCIKYYENVIMIDPHELDVIHRLGKILVDLGKTDKAIKCYENCSRFNKEDHLSYFYLGDIYFHQSEDCDEEEVEEEEKREGYRKAIKQYQKAMDIITRSRSKNNVTSTSTSRKKKKMIENLKNIEISKCLLMIGKCHFFLEEEENESEGEEEEEEKETIESIQYFEKSIQSNPFDEEAYIMKSKCLKRMDRIDEALDVIEIGKKKLMSYFSKINREQQQEYDYYFSKNNNNNNNNNKNLKNKFHRVDEKRLEKLYYEEGVLRMKKNEYKSAIRSFNSVLAINEKNIKGLLNRGNCYYCLKEFEMAMKNYNDSISINPTSEGFGNRGVIYWMIHSDVEKAMEDFIKCYVLSNSNTMNQKNLTDCSVRYLETLESRISSLTTSHHEEEIEENNSELIELKSKKIRVQNILKEIDEKKKKKKKKMKKNIVVSKTEKE